MHFDDYNDDLLTGIYEAFGQQVWWQGQSDWPSEPVQVWIKPAQPDEIVEFERTRVVVETVAFKVRSSEVPAPKAGDSYVASDGTYRLMGEPMADLRRKEWLCEARRVG